MRINAARGADRANFTSGEIYKAPQLIRTVTKKRPTASRSIAWSERNLFHPIQPRPVGVDGNAANDRYCQNRFRGDASIKTFLFAINKNTWLNELKRRGRAGVREAKFETAKETVDEGISMYIAGRESRIQVLEIMDKLGEGCKKILLAFYYENLSMKEILNTMNYENDQVLRNKKHKCLKQLEQLLTADPALAKTLKAALQYGQ